MKNLWKKLFSAGSALILTAGLAFGYTVVVDGIGLGNTTAPALTSCGTSPSIVGNDLAGTVTMGTATPTGCQITFNTAKSTAPICVVASQSAPAGVAPAYTVAATGISWVQTGLNSNKINYICMGQ